MGELRFISGKAALSQFIQGIQGAVSDRLEASGYNASGRLSRTMRNEVTEQPGATSAELFAAAHWKFVGNGRGPGRMPPVDPLIQWAKDKGLASEDSAATRMGWAIARNIAREGSLDHQLGGKNVFAEAIRAAQPGINDVLRAFARDIPQPLASEFKKAFA